VASSVGLVGSKFAFDMPSGTRDDGRGNVWSVYFAMHGGILRERSHEKKGEETGIGVPGRRVRLMGQWRLGYYEDEELTGRTPLQVLGVRSAKESFCSCCC
jgi:hypothetical protein